MNNFGAFKKGAIRYWERRRIYYNLALVLPMWVGYYTSFGRKWNGISGLSAGGMAAILAGLLIYALIANIFFSFGYALEFHFGTESPESRWAKQWRPALVVAGTLFGMFLAIRAGVELAAFASYFRR